MPLQLPREGIPQRKLTPKRKEMAATWRKKSRKAKIQDERFVMKKATERAGNCKLQKKKDKFHMCHSFPWIKFHFLVEEKDQ